MAVPSYLFQDYFESGDFSAWDVAESDVGTQLDVAHYSTLARDSGIAMPYSGAYTARWVLSSATNDATIGDANVDIADGETIWVRFPIWFSPSFATLSTANDTVPIIEFQEAGNAVIYSFGFVFVAATARLHWGLGEATPNTTVSASNIELGVWHIVELKVNVQTGAATGEIELYVTRDGQEPSTTVLSQDASNQSAGAVTHMVLGTQDKLATTQGTMLISEFIIDNARIWPDKDRYSARKTFLASQHIFVGPGRVDAMTLAASAATDNVITIYDTDTAQTHQALKRAQLQNTANGETVDAGNVPFEVTRGAYLEVVGTAHPQVTVEIGSAPAWFSEGATRRFGLRRNLNA